MRKQAIKAVVLLVGVFLVLVAVRVTTDVPIAEVVSAPAINIAQHKEEIVSSPIRLLFVGDIMLGRNVESLMDLNGIRYPFVNTEPLLKSADLTIGNFEGIVSKVHEKAEPMTFKFSVKREFLEVLKDVGFDMLSLANNHSYDYGSSAFTYTHELCVKFSLVCSGSPSTLDSNSIQTQVVNGRTVSILFIHTLYNEPDEETLSLLLASTTTQSDVQIAYIHWGEEYVLLHNEEQRLLSEFLIDHGIDVIVGHHPHVVQDVELYNGKPIFYSLGNFIFDQYFNRDVQQMVALNMEIGTSTITYSLVPLSSDVVRSQPSLLDEKQKKLLFERIFTDFESDKPQVVNTGKFILPL